MSTKGDIYQYIKSLTFSFDDMDNIANFTASNIAKNFNIKRNTASLYLNQLVETEKVMKINSRPVYFINMDRFIFDEPGKTTVTFESVEELRNSLPEFKLNAPELTDPFSTLIGAEGSLEKVIEQIKTALFYPNGGIPIFLNGPTGVGKSFMAKLMYQFCIENQLIEKHAPFVTLNCSQYANNPELLSSNLFGYVKGAFTGADFDKKGLFEEADKGILFLDEVHRLSAEGQEKLFTYLDSGNIYRVGETSKGRKVSVRLILATTEDISTQFLETFIRRIPIKVSIPALSNRSNYEKEQFVINFLIDEAKEINKDIEVSPSSRRLLLNYTYKGNVGELLNLVKYLVATSYFKNRDSKTVQVTLHDFPENILESVDKLTNIQFQVENKLFIKKDTDYKSFLLDNNSTDQYYQVYSSILNEFSGYMSGILNKDMFEQNVFKEIEMFFDNIIFNEGSKSNISPIMEFITIKMYEIFQIIETSYNIRFNGSTIYAISCYLFLKGNQRKIQSEQKELLNKLYEYVKYQYKSAHRLGTKLSKLIENKIDVAITETEQIILDLYLESKATYHGNYNIKAVILAHGYATASSIANVANRMLGSNIFEAFDMPLNTTPEKITANVLEYIEQNEIPEGLMILVDMGSLKDINKLFKKNVKVPLSIVNNVTTQMAIVVGEKIKQNIPLGDILKKVETSMLTEYKLIYPESNKKKAIVTACFTGMGTAMQIQQLLVKSIPSDLEINVIAKDFRQIKENGLEDAVFKMYDVLAIIGTADPEIDKYQYISLEELISGKGEQLLSEALGKEGSRSEVENINNNIVKNFSLKQVIGSLTILDTNRVIEHVNDSISSLEILLNTLLSNDKKISLYIHISCLIERLIRKEPIETYLDLEDFIKINEKEISMIKKGLNNIEKIYGVEIPTSELAYIYDILTFETNQNKKEDSF
ncbi:sigma-54 dependent transcriptional regulator of gfr operon [Virgibacillus halotolerans]|uniref:sigma 54-interacting transcriptional regulator n=1 Tax=Virgibacillus halotolerans TaxID=1071053 RepID=UPI001961B4CD|nr:sigma 54-interacting transcriptional regulator [Virgibacillus halotolerans]MBM7599018.1 sigma-54 dependent transcriptional regulator of gfr operon [Virgibacillus halotolerans]